LLLLGAGSFLLLSPPLSYVKMGLNNKKIPAATGASVRSGEWAPNQILPAILKLLGSLESIIAIKAYNLLC
jgi:hypothetical protein